MKTIPNAGSFIFLDARSLPLRRRVQLALSVLLTPLTLILMGRSIRVPTIPVEIPEVDSATITAIADVSGQIDDLGDGKGA